MTLMATSTHAHPRVTAPRRAEVAVATPRRRLTMVAACYAGIVLLVSLAVLATRVWPSGAVAPLFVLGMLALVGVFHPRVSVTRRIQ